MATNRLHEIQAQGTAIWIDTLSRELLDEGTLERLIADDGVTGVTSNPTIFKKAMEDSERYDRHLREAIAETSDPRQVYFRVAFADTRDACDLLRPVFQRTEGRDGYVSFELPPDLAYDVQGSVDAAGWCRDEISRPNVLIKVPGTEQGVRAFEELTAKGVNVNVTLLFSVLRYEEIGEAYLRGLERRVEKGEPIERSASVASFFVSRVDTKIDQALEERGRPELRGKAAVANAKLAYASFARMFSGERWQALQARGAHVQRPLWASTSTKNPAYPDTLYVDELIGPDTVNTMPDATLAAARDHATAERSIDRHVGQARAVLEQIRRAGVDADEITLRQLVDEGVTAFAGSFEALIDTIERKIRRPSRTRDAEVWRR
jgi:transaldolase